MTGFMLKSTGFRLNMVDSVLQMMDLVLQMMNFALKTMYFVLQSRPENGAERCTGGAVLRGASVCERSAVIL